MIEKLLNRLGYFKKPKWRRNDMVRLKTDGYEDNFKIIVDITFDSGIWLYIFTNQPNHRYMENLIEDIKI